METDEVTEDVNLWPKRFPRPVAVEYLAQVHGIRLSEKTLRNRHSQGTGPKCEYFGSRWLTKPTWMDEWAEDGLSNRPANRQAAPPIACTEQQADNGIEQMPASRQRQRAQRENAVA